MSNDIQKAIEKAFEFHPFGFERPQCYNEWVMGPTFIVKPGLSDEEMVFNSLAGVYIQDESWATKFKKILEEAPNATVELELSKNKHEAKPKCTYRLFSGEKDATYPLELAFPLLGLARKIGVTTWRTHPGANNVMVFGYRGDELIAVMAGRRVLADHVLEDKDE